MNSTLAYTREEPLPDRPLAITIPEPTRENAAFRALIRQAIPMLKNPEAHSRVARHQFAATLTQALEFTVPDIHTEGPFPPLTDADAPQEYEPGCDDWEETL